MKWMKGVQIIVLLVALILSGVAFMRNRPMRIVYVNMDQLFVGFQMKNELEKDFQSKSSDVEKQLELTRYKVGEYKEKLATGISKAYLDSLSIANAWLSDLTILYEENYIPLKEQYDSQIQNQLHDYMIAFGKSSDYDLVLTSLHGSTVVYGVDAVDVTQEALLFINERYAGK